jgi:hypothetical protein
MEALEKRQAIVGGVRGFPEEWLQSSATSSPDAGEAAAKA